MKSFQVDDKGNPGQSFKRRQQKSFTHTTTEQLHLNTFSGKVFQGSSKGDHLSWLQWSHRVSGSVSTSCKVQEPAMLHQGELQEQASSCLRSGVMFRVHRM